jgi:hypothetical protein
MSKPKAKAFYVYHVDCGECGEFGSPDCVTRAEAERSGYNKGYRFYKGKTLCPECLKKLGYKEKCLKLQIYSLGD